MTEPTDEPTEAQAEAQRRMLLFRQAMKDASQHFAANAFASRWAEARIAALLAAAVDIAREADKTDWMIAIFATLTGGAVEEQPGAPPDTLLN